jgi:hypothetical protein
MRQPWQTRPKAEITGNRYFIAIAKISSWYPVKIGWYPSVGWKVEAG